MAKYTTLNILPSGQSSSVLEDSQMLLIRRSALSDAQDELFSSRVWSGVQGWLLYHTVRSKHG